MKMMDINNTGNNYPDINRRKSMLPPLMAFFAGMAVTACLVLSPATGDTLLPQPAELDTIPVAPAMPHGGITLV